MKLFSEMNLPYSGIDPVKYDLIEDSAYQTLVEHMHAITNQTSYASTIYGIDIMLIYNVMRNDF